MTAQISDLEANGLITDFEGSWDSLLLLATKSHQESCDDINIFVWRLCVSYRPLNRTTLGFKFPILRCSGSIEDLDDSRGSLSMISLDDRSGYHQIHVRESDEKNLVFFTSSGTKKKFRVMPFDPKNAPVFYTTMIQYLRKEWLLLFADTKHVISCDNVSNTLIYNVNYDIYFK